MRPERRHRTVASAAAALALAAVTAGAVVLQLPAGGDITDRRPPRPLGAVEELRPTAGLGTALAAYGDLWVDDRSRDRLLRLRMPDGRVLARVPVRGRVALAAGAGGVWALQSNVGYGPYLRGPVLHLDPRTNRVRARVALRMPSGERLLARGVLAHGRDVWVWGAADVVRIDPRADRVAQRIRFDDAHGDLMGLAVRGRDLLVATADGTFLRMRPRTGALLGAARTRLRAPLIRATAGRRLIVSSRGFLAALDPDSGKVAWKRRLGFRVGSVVRAHGLLWVHSAAVDEPGDRLSGFDPDTGRIATTSILPAFGTTGLTALDGRLLVPSANGSMLVVRPLLL